jgi:hypothetical protein
MPYKIKINFQLINFLFDMKSCKINKIMDATEVFDSIKESL